MMQLTLLCTFMVHPGDLKFMLLVDGNLLDSILPELIHDGNCWQANDY